MMPEVFWQVDYGILHALQTIRTPLWDAVFRLITSLGDGGFIWILLSALLLIRKDTRRTGILCVLALLGSLLINNIILKNMVARMRPFDRYEDLIPLVARPQDFSFPSGHTGSSFAAAVVMFLNLPRKWGIPAIILAVVIAFSRLYVGVHYPSDVLAGMVTGTAIAVGVWLVAKKIENVRRNCDENVS